MPADTGSGADRPHLSIPLSLFFSGHGSDCRARTLFFGPNH